MWEKAYKEELEARGFEVHLEERRFGISATMIQEIKQILEIHCPALPSPVHEKVLIMGSASNGKRPCKDLAFFTMHLLA